jgi:uncharacterized protein DUF2795
MQRGSDQHGPRLDDELEHEVQSLVRGQPIESRAEEVRLEEGAGDDEAVAETVVARAVDEPVEAGLSHAEVRARSELARQLSGSLFPADRTALVQYAVEANLPPDLVESLRNLPSGRYANVEGVWEALGGHRETRDAHAADPGAVDADAAAEPRFTAAESTAAESGAPESGAPETTVEVETEGSGEPAAAGRVAPGSTERFAFRFDLLHRVAGAAFRVSPGSAEVLVDRTRSRPTLEVRFGPWHVETSVDNVESATVTGPYQPLKTVGPAHLSLADRGLTFGTNDARGLCIRFREPVRGLEPLGVVRHPSVTVTVADVDGLRAALQTGRRTS